MCTLEGRRPNARGTDLGPSVAFGDGPACRWKAPPPPSPVRHSVRDSVRCSVRCIHGTEARVDFGVAQLRVRTMDALMDAEASAREQPCEMVEGVGNTAEMHRGSRR